MFESLKRHPGYILFWLLLGVCIIADFYIARAQIPNADFTQNYREIFSLRDGNIWLRNWHLATDDFYFTDLPFYLVLSLFLGPSLAITYLAPWLIFTMLLLTALAIASRNAATHQARLISLLTLLFLIGIPFSPCTILLLTGAIHNGTILFALLIILLAQPALNGKTLNRLTLIPIGCLTFAVMASDPLGLVFCIAPLLILLTMRIWLRGRYIVDELWLAGTIGISLYLGSQFQNFMANHGGFTTTPAYGNDFIANLADLKANLQALRAGLRLLAASYQPVLGPGLLLTITAFIRHVSLIIIYLLALRIIWRAPHQRAANGVAHWLILGTITLFGLDALSHYFTTQTIYDAKYPDTATRFIIPGFVFLSLAAAIELPASIPKIWLKRAMLPASLAAAWYIGTAGLTAAGLAASPPAYLTTPRFALAQYLAANQLTYGVGPYWTAELTQALSQDHIIIDPIRANQPETLVAPYEWLCDTTSFTAHRRPQFALFSPDNGFGLSIADITATYGPPQKILNVYGFYVVEFAP